MPRVNRDLQRRLAARRERERRRPTERRYQFAPRDEPVLKQDESLGDGAQLTDESIAETETDGRRAGETAARAAAATRTADVRPNRGAVTRPASRPFSAYRDDYRYVIGDLRRILLVIGSLLLVLIVLALVLPR